MTLFVAGLSAGCGFRAAAPEARAIPLEITDAAPAADESHADTASDFPAATPGQLAPTDETSHDAPPSIPAYLYDDAISLYLEILLLDLLLPPSSTSPGGFTNLELLCRDQGIPDSVCRQRYGR